MCVHLQNEDKEMLEEVQKEVADIQTEIHNTLLVEEKELVSAVFFLQSLPCHVFFPWQALQTAVQSMAQSHQ